MWFMATLAGVILFFILLCLPETLRHFTSAKSEHKSKSSREVSMTRKVSTIDLTRPTKTHPESKNWSVYLKNALIGPLKIVLTFR